MLKGSREAILRRIQRISVHGQASWEIVFTHIDDPTEQLNAARQGGYHDGYRDGLAALDSFKQSFAAQTTAQVGALVQSYASQMDNLQQDMANAVADPVLVQQAADDDTAAAQRLLTLAAEIVSTDSPPDAALTVYGADGMPVAWAGRPSELLAERLQGREAWFPAPVAQGLRLVYVQPVTSGGMRVGTIAVERPIIPA